MRNYCVFPQEFREVRNADTTGPLFAEADLYRRGIVVISDVLRRFAAVSGFAVANLLQTPGHAPENACKIKDLRAFGSDAF